MPGDWFDEALDNEHERDFIDTPSRKKTMNKRVTPMPPPGSRPPPAAAAQEPVAHRAEVTEVLDKETVAGAQVPAKLTRLATAMESVKAKMTAIEQFGADVRDLIANNPADKKYDLTTKEGAKACDDARKLARQKRLAIKTAWDEGKAVIRGLGDDLKAAAEADMTQLRAIEDNAKSQQEAKAKAEEQRVQRHTDNIAAISIMAEGAATMTSVQLQERVQSMEAVIVDDSYEEYQDAATRKRREVIDVLVQAKAAAIEREAQARRDAEAQQAAAKELREAREREEARAAAKAKVDAIKALPDQLVGTDSANVREALRIHQANVPKAEEFGDMLDFAEMAHERTTRLLKEMADQLAEAEEHNAELADRAVSPAAGQPRGDDDADGLAMFAEPGAPGPDATIDMQPVDIKTSGNVTIGTPQADPDPFVAQPVVRRAARPAAPTPAPLPTVTANLTVAAIDAAMAEDVPDLLQAAVIAMDAYDALKAMPGGNTPISAVMHGPFGEAMEKLRAAISFTQEFAD